MAIPNGVFSVRAGIGFSGAAQYALEPPPAVLGTVNTPSTTGFANVVVLEPGYANAYLGILESGGPSKLWKYNLAGNSYTYKATISALNANVYPCILPNSSAIYVAVGSGAANNIVVMNPATGAVITTLTSPTLPFLPVPSPDSSVVYLNDGSTNVIYRILTASNTFASTFTLPVGVIPLGMCISPDGGTIYIGTQGTVYPQSIVAINASTGAVTGHFPVGSGSGSAVIGVAITPDGRYVVAATQTTPATMSVFDTTTATVITNQVLSTGSYPFVQPVITADGLYHYTSKLVAGTYSLEAWTIPGAVASGTTATAWSAGGIVAGIADTVPPPALPSKPTQKYRPLLFVPRKGMSIWNPTDVDINWNAIERWASAMGFPVIFPFRSQSRMLTANELDANWHRMEIWAASSGVYPPPDNVIAPLLIQRKNSTAPQDLSINFLRIQDWANGQ